jgi:5-methylthioadenosine/S-adenosylhomocysteine deaminase
MHTDFMNIREATRALDEMGIRAKMVYGLLDRTFAGQSLDADKMTMVHTRDELEKDFKRFFDQWHNRGNITAAIGAGSTQDASEELLKSSKHIADALGILVSTHVAGWQDILTSSYSRFGMRDVEFAHSRGLTGAHSLFIHTVWMSPEEISLLSMSGTSSVHCPAANSQLGYGIAPVPEMLHAGISVGLGTDGAGSYTYDMFEQMRLAAYLQKQKHQSADALTAEQALEMATIGGAAALGMSDEIGSLETGKKADMILIDFNQPHLMLTGRLAPKVVYSAHGSDVTGVVVNGRPLMVGRKLLDIDEAEELGQAHTVYTQLLEKAGKETFRLLKAPWGGKQPYWREKV